MARIRMVAVLMLLATPAQAVTISGGGEFIVEFHGEDGQLLNGSGFIEIRDSRYTAFEFEFQGMRWTLEDVAGMRCFACGPQNIYIEFSNGVGSGHLTWDFRQQAFSMLAGAFFGTSQDGRAGSTGVAIDSVSVVEPGTLVLCVLGLLALSAAGTRRSRQPLRETPRARSASGP